MYAVKTSPRALLVALLPLAAVHAVLVAMGLLETQTVPPQASLPSPDKLLAFFVGRLALDAALLFAGHLVLRQRAMAGRLEYALMGGAMAAASYAVALQNGMLLSQPPAGSEVSAGLLPTMAGLIAGFLYGQFAGLEPVGAWPQFSSEALKASQRFDGPVRVRTSAAAIAIAAIVPAALTAVLSFSLSWMFLPEHLVDGSAAIFAAALPAQMFMTFLVVTTVPAAILVLCVHHIVRALNRVRGLEYTALGGMLAALCALLLGPFTPFTSEFFLLVPALVYGGIMGALYRRFAGLEPAPLPEAVLVADADTLVGADHPSRRGHGVILQ